MNCRIACMMLAATLTAAPFAAQSAPPASPPDAPPAPPADPAAPASAADLEQRVRILERRLELAEEQKAEKDKSAAVVGVGAEGFTLKSAKGDFQLKLRGYLQFDGRFYVEDRSKPVTDTFVVRRARPVLEGTLFRIFDFKVMPDFGGGQSVLYDGYLEARFSKAARLRAGKFKPPIGLERLQSATDLVFVERGAPVLLVPSRDLGVQLSGEVAGSRLEYAIGIFNGVPDGGLGDADNADVKEFAGRLFWRPFQSADGGVARVDLGFGLAVSKGDEQGSVTAPALPSYKSYGSQTLFSYRSDGTAAGTVFADGRHDRLVPQAWLYAGPFGALAEWASSEQRVRREQLVADVENRAWQLQLSWVLTGERNSYKGIAPRRPFDSKLKGRGAWLVAARLSEVKVDDAAFPLFADSAKSVRKASAWGAGVSWNLVRGVRWMLDYNETRFDGGASGGDRPTEKALFTRFQVAF